VIVADVDVGRTGGKIPADEETLHRTAGETLNRHKVSYTLARYTSSR